MTADAPVTSVGAYGGGGWSWAGPDHLVWPAPTGGCCSCRRRAEAPGPVRGRAGLGACGDSRRVPGSRSCSKARTAATSPSSPPTARSPPSGSPGMRTTRGTRRGRRTGRALRGTSGISAGCPGTRRGSRSAGPMGARSWSWPAVTRSQSASRASLRTVMRSRTSPTSRGGPTSGSRHPTAARRGRCSPRSASTPSRRGARASVRSRGRPMRARSRSTATRTASAASSSCLHLWSTPQAPSPPAPSGGAPGCLQMASAVESRGMALRARLGSGGHRLHPIRRAHAEQRHGASSRYRRSTRRGPRSGRAGSRRRGSSSRRP